MVNHEKGSVITSCACPPPVSLSPFSTLSSPSMCVCQTALWVVASHVTWANRRRYIPAEHSFALRGFPPLSPSLPSLCFCPFRYWIQLELWAILPFFLLFAAFLGQIITKRMFFCAQMQWAMHYFALTVMLAACKNTLHAEKSLNIFLVTTKAEKHYCVCWERDWTDSAATIKRLFSVVL